ncbi:hypothetical protein ACFO4E_04920 [Nocardiopsis mangrovi]|uniref:Uncharacterized protein n=1 Tax=Nocardiopsis mangrovi TaxID=1179818 RepID=A0ABV9DR76_9ACTN
MTQPPSGGPGEGPSGPFGGSPSAPRPETPPERPTDTPPGRPDPQARPGPGYPHEQGDPGQRHPGPAAAHHHQGQDPPPGYGPAAQGAPRPAEPARPQEGGPGAAQGFPGRPAPGPPPAPGGHPAGQGPSQGPVPFAPVSGSGGPGPQPAYGAPPPEAPPVRAAPQQSRGCATAAISVLAVIALLLVVAGVWAIVSLAGGGGGYQSAPDCAVGETAALESLVPEYSEELAQPLEGMDESWRDGYECRWGTPSDAVAVPATARLVLVRVGDRGATDGEQGAAEALRAAPRDNDVREVDDLGDEATAWNESSQGFAWGCVGVRLANLFTLSCYTASIDYQVSGAIPEDDALAGAEELASATAAAIEDGDY